MHNENNVHTNRNFDTFWPRSGLGVALRPNSVTSVFAAVVLVLAGAAPAARAAAIDTVTLTPSGTNTVFTISGTYPADTTTTPYSFPNTNYSLMFALPTAPSSFAFVDDSDGIFAIDTTVTLNSVQFVNSEIAFFTPFLGGGLDVCLSEGCSPDPPTNFLRFVISGDQLFSGDVFHPIFNAGVANLDQSGTFIESPVPEPAGFALAGGGIVMLAIFRKRHLRS